MSGKHEAARQKGPPRALIVAGLCVVAVMAGVFAGATMWGVQEQSQAQGPIVQPAAKRVATAPAAPAVSELQQSLLLSTEGSCRLANLRQRTAVSAAAVSLAQFQKHMEAMNLLVAGEISFAVATKFWDQTRVAALGNVAAFRAADRYVGSSIPGCAPLAEDLTGVAGPARAAAIARCAASSSAQELVLRLARPTVANWEHHVHDMERLRRGELTPDQASAAWKKSWKTGLAQYAAYDAAMKKAAATPCDLS